MRIIPTIVHGIVDYLMVTVLFFLPYLMRTSDAVQLFLMMMACLILLYSLFTYYEAGAWKLLPMRLHLALDALSGVIFLLAAVLVTETAMVRGMLALIGVFEIAAALLTIPEPFAQGPGARISGRSTRPPQPGL